MTMSRSTTAKDHGRIPDESGGWTEMLRDGDRIRIRPIEVGDTDMERKFIEGLSPQSRRFRFLDSMSSPSEALLRKMTEIDPRTDVAYVALIDDEALDQEIGVGRFSALPGGADCEFSLTVSDKWQRKGVATHLMHHLLEAARQRGIATMHSSDASDNDRMRKFATHLRLDHTVDPDDTTQVLYSLKVEPAN